MYNASLSYRRPVAVYVTPIVKGSASTVQSRATAALPLARRNPVDSVAKPVGHTNLSCFYHINAEDKQFKCTRLRRGYII